MGKTLKKEKRETKYEEDEKIFAVLLTLAMVLGMSMTSFAAETTAPSAADKATITVTGIENGATVKKLIVL